ncbi:DNA polymerase IV [Speluncibacter jeojiensis]|uniref:DNA-directed DNA polymerase n=1 Tax=Speluncibacter jeojiensis TaxID=2710754 RepID=A0A9X4RE49_9ACTN|nr:DNA polymerase IV [Corynebacteriales bacterium D3-21]
MPTPWVLHVDLDQFVAAVEILRRPELAGLPVVVGGHGDPTERGVVSTASYEAREYGVGSGMPLRVAARKLPGDAVFLPVDAPAYTTASNAVMNTLRATGAVVEVLGWDEAFLGVDTDDPESVAQSVQAAVLDATALHCSIGIGDNKLRAKIATGFGKPRGLFRLTANNWWQVMGERPADALWGIGGKTAKKLAALDIHTVVELASAPIDMLAATFGPKTGPWLHHLAYGHGARTVSAEPYRARSHSREITFQQDVADWGRLAAEVRDLATRVAADIAAEHRPAIRVALKVRYAPFDTHTTSASLTEPTSDPCELAEAAATLVDRLDHDRKVRLIGVRLEMVPSGDAT